MLALDGAAGREVVLLVYGGKGGLSGSGRGLTSSPRQSRGGFGMGKEKAAKAGFGVKFGCRSAGRAKRPLRASRFP